MQPKPLRLLGLAKNAGRLVWGLDAVKGAMDRASLLILASDAGTSVTREGERLSQQYGIPAVRLPYDRQTVGAAIGRTLCAIAAVTDKGLYQGITAALQMEGPA